MHDPALVPADTAWMLASSALVLLMTPALAFFYGGLVRSKNALNTMMMSVSALGFVGVAWAVLGYTLSFAEGSALLGGLQKAFLSGVGLNAQGTIPELLFIRPCDANETIEAWRIAIANRHRPTCLALTRQNVPTPIPSCV